MNKAGDKKQVARCKIGVRLEPITVKNWQVCIALAVKEEQVDLLPSNLYSIAQAQFYPQAVPLAIYGDKDEMVGFVMYGVDVASNSWKVFRLMIDQAHQGRGYGRAAMEQVIERLSARSDCSEILIVYRVENKAARRLYESLGFVKESAIDGKVTARLDLKQG